MNSREEKRESGHGPVSINGMTFYAKWEYRYTQEYLEVPGPRVEALKKNPRWTIWISLHEYTKWPSLRRGTKVTVQVGNMPTAASAYVQDAMAKADKCVIDFGSEPSG